MNQLQLLIEKIRAKIMAKNGVKKRRRNRLFFDSLGAAPTIINFSQKYSAKNGGE